MKRKSCFKENKLIDINNETRDQESTNNIQFFLSRAKKKRKGKNRRIFPVVYNVNAQTFKTAIEAACMLARIIDHIESRIKKKQAPGAGPTKPTIESETEGDADN
ncbi:hypothetical protein HID58_084508 [Brassica napus]|uniref:Uncharacterized protein n=1 Tax=Brassica napus TaxID=3708 RepID=A0ABQ7XJX1_BRANA|nr:hypothetical protein HID58_084508 [Brassica napus]